MNSDAKEEDINVPPSICPIPIPPPPPPPFNAAVPIIAQPVRNADTDNHDTSGGSMFDNMQHHL